MSEICKNWSQWLKSTRFSYMDETQLSQTMNWLKLVRDIILNNASIKPNDTVIDIGTGTGLLAFGVLERLNEKGKIIFSDKFEDCLQECKKFLATLDIVPQYEFLLSGCEDIKLPKEAVDKALMRSVMVHILDKQVAINEIYRIIKFGGIFSAFEPIINSNTRYYELVTPDDVNDYEDFKRAESELMSDPNDSLTNFNAESLGANLENAGFKNATIDVQESASRYLVKPNTVPTWFDAPPSPGAKSMKEKFLLYFDEAKVNKFIASVDKTLTGKEIDVKSKVALIRAIKD
ncbi:MAG: class I SAM-dependent methyltransferase [Candidatus Gastranaerophilales bacterium]|nr:class I SAM-dependent methyltransferase [Candidatus Gastranaerophilales bacterium]